MLLIENLIKELRRPQPYEPGARLWTDEHIAGEMLAAHLLPDTDAASYKPAIIRAICSNVSVRTELKPGDTVLDLGCGPGLYCHQLAE